MDSKKDKLYAYILRQKNLRKKMIAVLLDPDKYTGDELPYGEICKAQPDFIFVGGSGINHSIEDFVSELKQQVDIPVVLFPGDVQQFTPQADGLLLLSLISGRNPDLLIGQHVKAACAIATSGVEVLPTGYILVDGGKQSSVERVSRTQPLSEDDPRTILSTALAGQLLGMKLVYLEAGSGAAHAISATTIQTVSTGLSIPLIVGGGIRSIQQIDTALQAGADLLVVGNHFEAHPEDILPFTAYVHQWKA